MSEIREDIKVISAFQRHVPGEGWMMVVVWVRVDKTGKAISGTAREETLSV